MGFLGGFEWLIIVLVLLLLFGAKKIPEIARGIGQGIFEFRKATNDGKKELEKKKEKAKEEKAKEENINENLEEKENTKEKESQ
ncbi:MAG: twin-arginine translocase TatA/TatE family subunit [Balneolales bacterium]